MTLLAPTLETFFIDRLIHQRDASPNTIAAYRDAFRLLLNFVHQQTGISPAQLEFTDVDAVCISAFLHHLETDRGNSVRTRNARLAAVHSMFKFAALRHPEHAALIQRVLAIPHKRADQKLICFLTPDEVDALLAAPDRSSWLGRRDHALLATAIQTGLRVSELAGLTRGDLELGTGPHVRCHGKGRKDRITPLTRQTVTVLRTWLDERGGQPSDPLFPTRQGHQLSRDAIEHIVRRHAATATNRCASIATKKLSPHVLRHTCAMRLLQAGVDTSVIALWLGHESVETTQIYLHADLALKEQALARTTPPTVQTGRYRPADTLLTFLEAL
jgi:integrase/recombinase XerD